MKKFLNKENLQKILFASVIVLVFGVFMLSLVMGSSTNDEEKNPIEQPNNNDNQQENNENNKLPEDKPNVQPKEKFNSPCSSDCNVARYFYSIDDEKEIQEMSLIQFGTKFYISKGVSYTKEDGETFDVIAALSGKIIDISESNVYGTTVTIDHGNNVLTEYIGLSEVTVELNQEVSQGQVIGCSGEAEYDSVLSSHVHFRISKDGEYLNPLNVYGKTLDDFNLNE